jgi:DNA-binding NarL/FixJ family response regulator
VTGPDARAPEGRDARPEERAVVVDELALLRLGVISVLHAQGVDVVAETQSGREAVSVATIERPDLVVVGRPADLPAADTVLRLSRLRPSPAVVALVAPGNEPDVAYLVALGTRGIALRVGNAEDLADVIGAARKGAQQVVAALQPSLAGSLRPRPDAPDDLLSAREREVLACLAQGRSNREIAATLLVTLATVKSHLVRIYAKLEANNRNEALGRAVALGLLS